MQYLMLIYSNETEDEARPDSAKQEIWNGYMAFTKNVREAGVLVDGNPLEKTAQATTVRLRDGKTLTTDGPFAETKEQLGGYYLLECDNLAQAIEYASQIPTAGYGSIEIRPIMKMG